MASIKGLVKGVKKAPQHLPHGTSKKTGIKGFLFDKGERVAFASGFGFAKGYYGDKFIWKGHGADAWLGVAGWLGYMIACGVGGKAMHLADHLERFGDAGVMSAANSYFAAVGLEKSGSKVAVVKPNKAPGVHGIMGDVLGAIAGAKQGPYLSVDRIANFSQPR